MSKQYMKKPEFVEVMYVTDDTFDAPHPNEDHMTGMTFYPESRTVELDNPCHAADECRYAGIGDVIVRHVSDNEGEWDSIWKKDAFERAFIPPFVWATISVSGDVVCLHCGRGLGN